MTKPELILQMRRVSDAMITLGGDMSSYGLDNDDHRLADKGLELIDFGMKLAYWQSAAEKDENNE